MNAPGIALRGILLFVVGNMHAYRFEAADKEVDFDTAVEKVKGKDEK
jgi:hypothetical protein